MEALVSIIMPVYNTAAYLEESVGSVLAQEHRNWELLMVDDGSTDASGKLCDRLAAGDSRIRVIHQENAGVSAARNRGLEEAGGDYICFLDSDDLLDPAYLAWFLRKKEESGADYICCGHGEKREEAVHWGDQPAPRPLMEAEEFVCLSLEDRLKLPLVCWSWLFPKEKLKDHTFEKGIAFGEDTLFVLSLLARGGRVYYEPLPHYIYRMDRAGSTLANTSLDKMEKTVKIWRRIQKLYPQGSDPRALTDKVMLGYTAAVQRKAASLKNREKQKSYRRLSGRCWRAILPAKRISVKDKLRLLFYWTMPQCSEKVMMKWKGRV